MKFVNIDNIVKSGLCVGCGACAAVCPLRAIVLREKANAGIQPSIDFGVCNNCRLCVEVCPGVGASHNHSNNGYIPELIKSWGPVIEVWQGFAKDDEIRFAGSSGGVVTALALFALKEQNISGVLHTAASCDSPLKNVPVFSRTREELLLASGSRYSPAAPCEKIGLIQEADSGCVFIGKSCDIQAVEKLKAVRKGLSDKIKLSIGIFCAGTPTTRGTIELLNNMEVQAEDVSSIRYRGNGWPGKTTVKINSEKNTVKQLDYKKAWGSVLANHIQSRCLLCPDTTAEFADISCGDAWHVKRDSQNPGCSLILVRTEAGCHFLHQAVKAGYLEVTKVEPSVLAQSQKPLLIKRATIWGRLSALILLGKPAPRYSGFHLFANWIKLPVTKKIKTFLAMIRRQVSTKRNNK
ncbi:MAG: Coenzyme F420 hydrogenase/dehydrogenase, beta subunit C-terminal domain [Sedimentisphaerales bacterium]|nr:Coenzyme F420 hydrogenase/dehydrogenase, beta subunit C-terminal domain [Sedimentisphaerales bacterium]